MAKVDFNVSNYARLFGKTQYDRKVLTDIVNDEELMGINESWYLTQGSIDPTFTPTDAHGMATFTVNERSLNAAPMASLRAPLSDAEPLDGATINSYAATIPDFTTPKIVEKAMERKQREDLFAQFGTDAPIINEQWIPQVQALRQSMNFTMNWMTAQLMTTAKIVYKHGQGIFAPVHKALVPDANFAKAGKTAWTDLNATIITDMQRIEGEYRAKWGYDGGMQWQMTKNFFLTCFIKNKEVLEKVNEFRALNDLIAVSFNNINTDVFYQEQIERIMSYTQPTPPPGGGGGTQPPTPPTKRIRQASLQTKTKLPITNAEDIDHYLEGLRQQLLKLLVDHDGVMITK